MHDGQKTGGGGVFFKDGYLKVGILLSSMNQEHNTFTLAFFCHTESVQSLSDRSNANADPNLPLLIPLQDF